jgi:hypothetical protein
MKNLGAASNDQKFEVASDEYILVLGATIRFALILIRSNV